MDGPGGRGVAYEAHHSMTKTGIVIITYATAISKPQLAGGSANERSRSMTTGSSDGQPAEPPARSLTDHLSDHESQKLSLNAGSRLASSASRRSRRSAPLRPGSAEADRLGLLPDRFLDLEPLGEQEDQGRIDVVDAGSASLKLLVSHGQHRSARLDRATIG